MALDPFSRDCPLWVNTFEGLSNNCSTIIDLKDGVLLIEICKRIAPSFFEFHVVTEKRINLQNVVRGIHKYFRTEESPVNIEELADDKDLASLKLLMEYIVCMAVKCPNEQARDGFISAIMGMPEESQLTLMNLAKAGMERSDLMGEVCGETNTNSLDVESEVKAKLGYLSEQNEELLRTVKALRDEAAATSRSHLGDLERARSSLQTTVDELQVELARKNADLDLAEDDRQSLKADYEQRHAKDTSKWESQSKRLEEEKDILTGKLEDFSKLKSQGERMKDKIEELDMALRNAKDKCALLEEANAKRLDRILELEGLEMDREQNKKRLEQSRIMAKDLELKNMQLSSEVDVKNEEIISLGEAVKSMKDKVLYFQNELVEAKAELEKGHAEAAHLTFRAAPVQDFISPELAEKVTRLERENEALRNQANDTRATDERERRCTELEQAAVTFQRDLSIEVERTEQLKATVFQREATILADLEAQGVVLQSKIAEFQSLTLTVGKLNDALKKKDAENSKLGADKEKLETYTKKALHNVQDKYMLAIKTCKEQLKEKDERIQKLTEQYKQFRQHSQRENQLMSSAIYELGMSITEQRLVRNLDKSGRSAQQQPRDGASKPTPETT